MNLLQWFRSTIARRTAGAKLPAGGPGQARHTLLPEKALVDAVIDSLPGVFYVFDEEGRLVRWNTNSERVSGYSSDELSRIHMNRLVPPEEREHLAAAVREVYFAGSAETRVNIMTKNGERRPYFVTGIRVEVGGRKFLVGTGIDMSEQKKTEEALREERNKSEAIIAAMGDGISVHDTDFRIVYQNERHKSFVGSHVGEYCYRAYEHADAVCDYCPIALSYRDGKVHVIERSVTDERGTLYLEIAASPLRDASGAIVGGIEAVRNITHHKQIEQELRESEEKFRALIESTSDWIWEIDSNGVYTYASPKVRELLGYAPGEVLGKTPFDLMTPEEAVRLRQQVASIIGGRMPFQRLENANLHKDGRVIILETSGVPIFDKDGRWKGYRGIDRDITERKMAEESREEMNRTLQSRVQEEVAKNREKDRLMMIQGRQAALGEMLGNIAHQWRQPLNMIGLIIQDLHDAQVHGLLTPEYLEKGVHRGMDVIQHMSQTIDDFRSFYRPDREKQVFSLNEVIDRVLSFIDAGFRNNGIAIDLRTDEALSAEGYPNEFAQVLLNILNNAKDALIERKVRSPRVTIRLFRDEGRPTVTVSDNGGGIPPDDLSRIFDPYFTTKHDGKGTGIGLYMSKIIIEKNMSGRLTARNTPDGAELRIGV